MNLSACKLSTNLQSSEHYGFPRPGNLIPTLGDHKAIALFVYFDDLPFEQRQFDEWKNNQIPTFEKYVAAMSYGKLKYKVDIYEKPIRISKSVLTYNLDTAHDAPMKANANTSGLVSDAVFAVDSEIDFSKYEFVNVITPWTRLIGFEGTTGVNIKVDGKQFNFASFGPIREYLDDPTKKIWLLHEAGHMMGLIHQFNVRADWGPAGYPIWSAMANGTSAVPEFMAWERFLLGWLGAEQVRCIENFDQGVFTSKLSSLSASDSEAKTILIKLGGSQILVIESRRASDLSILSKEEEGVLVYTVDVNVRGNDGSANLVFNSPKTRKLPNGGGALIGTLQAGEKVTSGGIKVEILSSDASGDIVRVSKG
jgi:M6 family metalloprotease-like protein